MHGIGGTVARLAEAIVRELEETGYLETPLKVIAEELAVSSLEAEEALALVQSLDPPGIAARSLEECVALQARAADRYDPAMARLIANLDLLAKGRMADLRRICGVDEDDLADMVQELRAYDPKPGCRFVTTVHGNYSLKPFKYLKKFYNSVMLKGDKVIAVSKLPSAL